MGANYKAMGLLDKLFNPKTDSNPPNAGTALYNSLVRVCVTETFKIADKKEGSEIEAILYFSQLVSYNLIANYYKSNQKVLVENFEKDFTNAMVKDLYVNAIGNYVTNSTAFINSRSKFYWSQWVKYNKEVEAYYKTERPEKTFAAFTKYIHQHYLFKYSLDLIYRIPFEQFDDVPPLVISGDLLKNMSTEVRFVQLIAIAWDSVHDKLRNLHNEGVF